MKEIRLASIQGYKAICPICQEIAEFDLKFMIKMSAPDGNDHVHGTDVPCMIRIRSCIHFKGTIPYEGIMNSLQQTPATQRVAIFEG